MIVSTKGRYALSVMMDLAEHNTGEYLLLMDIAARQGISEKYLEGIMSVLSKNGLVLSLRGRGGGYMLIKSPEEYTVGSILKLTEGSLSPVSCTEGQGAQCARASECRMFPMWAKLDRMIEEYFEGITIADLVREGGGGNYVI
ncbi:MAG TPA: Rrf2 family transcriptional regulator [Clostridia bacterium]|nr:Rrf2 family transcriptional regulator [Clostridia bacterium]